MTNSTKLIGLIMTAALCASRVAFNVANTGFAFGQGMPAASSNDEIPPDLTLPLPQGAIQPTGPSDNSATPVPANDTQAAQTADGYYAPPESCDTYHPSVGGLWMQLAPIESTGTWLRRGFWYAEADAVIFNRMWSRADLRVAAEDPNVTLPPINPAPGVNGSLGFNPLFLATNRILILNGALPGEDATVRATLGNFLFRDAHNNDHTVEFTAIGGGDWEQDRTMSSATPMRLFVPFRIAGLNPTFNQSSRQEIDYLSDIKSFEGNYRVRARLGHDQLIMDANGDWHRAANAGFEREYLVGLRFLELDERLNWTAQDIATAGADGSYNIGTRNDLFGFQLGTGLTWQAPRWSLGTNVKGGVFVNSAVGTQALDFTANDTNDFNERMRENQLSFVGEFRLQGRYHLLPNVSVRAGYEMLLITSAALAPNQATFTPDTTYLNTTGNPFYHGASFGLEYFW